MLMMPHPLSLFFFFNDTATTEIYTLSLHDALPIFSPITVAGTGEIHQYRLTDWSEGRFGGQTVVFAIPVDDVATTVAQRSEEHTSELQSRLHLVCRLLLEKKKNQLKH